MSDNLITLDGWISDYWEQGMERLPYWVFQDKNYCKNRNEGWLLDGMHILQTGQQLSIFDDDKSVLWNGTISPRKTGFMKLKILYPDDYEWCPEDVLFEDWESWFKRKPPLKARLTINGGK